MNTNVIKISKAGKRIYGQEYKADFYRNGVLVNTLVCFGSDLKSIRYWYTKDFDKAEVIRTWLKKKNKKAKKVGKK